MAKANGYTTTAAFERFMSSCVAADKLVFADLGFLDLEAEARVLIDWLAKGERFYRSEDTTELSIRGRLWLLPRVHDSALKKSIEDNLKTSVAAH